MVTTTSDMVWNSISKRPRSSHKGTFGSVLAVAGSASYRGAAALAVEGALRTGAGIVTLVSVEPVLAAVSARLPECCLCPCEAGAAGGIAPENIPRIQRQKATVLLLGPGLGYTVQSAARAAETRMLAGTLLPGFAGSDAPADLSAFADGGSVSGWARAGMADAVALGLFGGTQDTGGRVWLRPGESATRAEIAAVLARFGRNVAHLL